MTPRLGKLMLTTHVTVSVGWLGAVVAYLVLALAALTGEDASRVDASYFAMESIGWFVIVPACVAALLTGLVQSLGSAGGLFRHYWVTVKFVLTAVATAVLLGHMPAVSRMSRAAAGEASSADPGALPLQLVVHAAGGLLVLLTATVLSVYKPWGRFRRA